MFLSILLLGSIVTLIFVYLLGKNNERYWNKKGVKFYEKNKVAGVFWDFFTKNAPMFEIFNELYNDFKNEPAVGIGSFFTPSLFVTDPKNVQHVLQNDFNSFYHRGMDVIESDKLANNIVFLNGPKWKLIRQGMSPLFTATKLKNMYYIMDKIGQDLVSYLKENPKSWEGNCYETVMTFCNAAVCGAIFGISSESIFDSPFLKLAKDVNKSSFILNMKFAVLSMSSQLSKWLGISLFKEHEDFFIEAVTKVIQEREKENIKRHDFADVCVSIRKNGVMKDSASGYEVEPSYEVLSAQAMFFLVAGVEPVAIVVFSALTHIGRNPDILEKLHREIDEHFEKNGNKITYDVISEMKYVDKVLSETMRMNPPIGLLIRECMQDSVLPVGNIKVDKGTKMFCPVYALHHDSQYYPNPEVFDPERFTNVSKINDDHYLPFGMGNRMCIGARYSKLQMAASFVHLLRHFTVKTKELEGPKFKVHMNNVRQVNVDVQLIPRNIK